MPTVNSFLKKFTWLRAQGLQSRYQWALGKSFRGLLKFRYHNRKQCGYISLCQGGGFSLLFALQYWQFQRGNLGTANSIFPSQFPSRFPVAWEPQKGVVPFPSLSSSGGCRSGLVCSTDSGKGTRPSVAKETQAPTSCPGLMSGNCKSPGFMIN